MTSKSSNAKRRRFYLLLLGALLLLLALGWLLYWALFGRFDIYTDDAYVHGNEVMLTPQIEASVAAIYADDTDLVEQGQLLVDLDPSDYEIAFEEQQKLLAKTVRDVVALFDNVGAKQAEVALRKAQLRQAELDYQHRIPLVQTGAVSLESFETYETDVSVASSSLELAEMELKMAEALVVGTTVRTHPRVEEVVWALKQSYLNLIRCHILAPVTGYIAKRTVQVGDRVKLGETLLYVVPLSEIWIEANYKETQIKKMRIGQPAHYTADMYGRGLKFEGKIVGFQPGSGNAFALLPPENASGNWIKIIQRVPVRISVDPYELRKYPLFLGLSMRTHVDVSDRRGERLASEPTMSPLYTTPIFEKQYEKMEEIEALIEKILSDNI